MKGIFSFSPKSVLSEKSQTSIASYINLCSIQFCIYTCCTPEEPCGDGEGDCDGPGEGGQHDGDAG